MIAKKKSMFYKMQNSNLVFRGTLMIKSVLSVICVTLISCYTPNSFADYAYQGMDRMQMKTALSIGIGEGGIEIREEDKGDRWCRRHPERCERYRSDRYRSDSYRSDRYRSERHDRYRSDDSYCRRNPWACEQDYRRD